MNRPIRRPADACRIHRIRQPGRAHGAAHHRSRFSDDNLGAPAEKAAAREVSRSSGSSFALNVLSGSGGVEALGGHTGPLLAKDVRLVVDIAEHAAADGGIALAAADAALNLMKHPR
jgi:hypothetical protein